MDLSEFYIGDNIDILKSIEDESVDLIFIDPPYSTGRNFDDFDDKFESNVSYARDFMMPRLREAHRVLKQSGSIIVHIEPKISHHIRYVLDDIFGESNFRNEIVWVSGGNKQSKNKLQRFHDTLIVYSKSSKYTYNPLYVPYTEEYKNKLKWDETHEDYYSTSAIHNSQPDVNPRPNLRYEFNGHYKQWYVKKEKLQKLHDECRLEYSQKGIPRVKKFLKELNGVQIRDVWSDIKQIQSGEKLNYATQKPIELLKRLINMFSNEGDVVIDFFAGSGSTGRACISTNRKYILIDKNKKGKDLFKKSIEKISNSSENKSTIETKEIENKAEDHIVEETIKPPKKKKVARKAPPKEETKQTSLDDAIANMSKEFEDF